MREWTSGRLAVMGMGRALRGMALTLAIACALLGQRAKGQYFLMSMRGDGPSGVAVSRRTVEEYANLLSLDKDQREVVKTLAEGYRDAARSHAKETKEKMEAIETAERGKDDHTKIMKEMTRLVRDYEKKCKEMEESFFGDLKATLTAEQAGKMEAVERHRRRDLYLRMDFVRGQDVNLLTMMDKVRPEWKKDGAVREVMERYEQSLDGVLKAYEGVAKATFTKMMDDLEKMDHEPGEEMEGEIKPLVDQGKKVRDVDVEAARQLRTVLTEKEAGALDLEINRVTYKAIYRESQAQRAFAVFSKAGELDETQKSRMDSLKAQYEKDLGIVNAKWSRALAEEEERAGGKQAMMRTVWQNADKDTDLKRAREERRQLDTRTMERLTDILKEEQRVRIPVKKPEENGLFEGWAELDMRGGGEGGGDEE